MLFDTIIMLKKVICKKGRKIAQVRTFFTQIKTFIMLTYNNLAGSTAVQIYNACEKRISGGGI